MALPKDVRIPTSSGQFVKLQEGANRFRFLSDVITGWEGWFQKKPFRHPGDTCNIKPEQVDLNQNGKPNINYFWAAIVWNYGEKRLQVLEITQKTIMSPLYDMEQNADWGDLKGYDISINKKKEGDKTSYTVMGIPPKPLAEDIAKLYEESDIKLEALFDGKYPMKEDEVDDNFGV